MRASTHPESNSHTSSRGTARRLGRIMLLGLVVAGLVVAGTSAWAQRQGEALAGAFFKRRLEHRVDAALDAIAAAPAQRAAIHASLTRVFDAGRTLHRDHAGDFDRALDLFAAEQLDPAALAALRSEHLNVRRQMADTVVAALHETFDALTSAQRRALAAYVRTQLPERRVHGDRLRGFAEHRIDRGLTAAGVAPAHIEALAPVRAELRAAWTANRPSAAIVEQALTLLSADRWDQTKVDALVAEHQAAAEHMGDAVLHAVTTARNTLTADERQALVSHIRQARARWLDHAAAHDERWRNPSGAESQE